MESKALSKHWGADYITDDIVRFRLWASGQEKVVLRLAQRFLTMLPHGDGWFELQVAQVAPGTPYQYVLANGMAIADPASRAQQTDVHGPSLVINPALYHWKNTAWRGHQWEEAVIYELHIGTFTPEGTFRAAIKKLPYLAGLGITFIEVMPVSQFSGNRGWGYDGVLLYAPHCAYGTPDDMKDFVDAAHGYGLSVIMDIVLNHFGPDGNNLALLSPEFFHPERVTPWGAGIAYDVEAARAYIADAPYYWLNEYHLDGLRFDAIDQIVDTATTPVLLEIAQRIRAEITDRPIHLITEDCRNIIALHPRTAEGDAPLFTAEWNDDVHNAAHVLATGETHGWYQDFAAEPEKHLARALAEGFAYQGERSPQTGKNRGVKSRQQPPVAFVDFMQNHDQVGNRAGGERLISLAGSGRTRVLLAMLLLSPHIPLLFMGEEYGETRPFLFFTDFQGELARAVREGRTAEFAADEGYAHTDISDPNSADTFLRSTLDATGPDTPQGKIWLSLTRHLLTLRYRHIVPLLAQTGGETGHVVQTAPGFFAVSWTLSQGTLSMALNLGERTQPLPDFPGDTLFSLPDNATELAQNTLIVRLARRDAQ